MNYVLFAKMDQVFSLKNKTLKNTGKMEKDTGKVREFCQSRKVGTLGWEHVQCVYYRPPTKLWEGNVFSRVCLSGGDPI